MSAPARWASVVLSAALLAAAPAAASATPRVSADPAVSEWLGWPYRAACRSLSFNPNRVFAEVPAAGLGRSPLDRALRHALHLFGRGEIDHDWRLARRAHGHAGFVRGRPGAELESGHELEYLELRRSHSRWRPAAYDQKCWLWTMRRGRSADNWFLAPGQSPLGPDTRIIHVISGAHCSRREKRPTLAGRPRFDEIGSKLVMTLWLRHPYVPGKVCEPGLPPWPPLTIRLPEPLGDREIFDGGEYPPSAATAYEEPLGIGL